MYIEFKKKLFLHYSPKSQNACVNASVLVSFPKK